MVVSKAKEEKAFRLLDDDRWRWRTKQTLKDETEMNEDDFNDFIQRNSNEIIKSTIPDPFDNELYGLRKKVSREKA